MQCHACDLRVEIGNDWAVLTGVGGVPGDSRAAAPTEAELDAFVHRSVDDWRGLPITPAVRGLLEHAEKITRRAWECRESDVASLRGLGWSDRAIHDAVQVIGYFNYINRVADALGVGPEPGLPHWGAKRPP